MVFSVRNSTLVLLSALIVAGCQSSHRPSQKSSVNTVQAEVLLVEESTRLVSVTYSGTIRAELNSTLYSKVMGKVESVSVNVGDRVTRGQRLLSIDSRELSSAVQMAEANIAASRAGENSAKSAAAMESATSKARIAQAESAVQQAKAALVAAEAQRDLAKNGPRPQEITQAELAVSQAESQHRLAQEDLDRARRLESEGIIPRKDLDAAQTRFDVTKAQLDSARKSLEMAFEGTRKEQLRTAEQGVAVARANVKRAEAAVVEAKAAAMMVSVRQREVESARAQVQQSSAAASAARVSLGYATISAPFDGVITSRTADPGLLTGPSVPLLVMEGGELRLEVSIPENDIGRLSIGDAATITIDGKSGKSWIGHLKELSPQGDSQSHTFIAKFGIKSPEDLRSGTFGRANVATGDPVRSIWVKSNQIIAREGLKYVFTVAKDDIARLTLVTTGTTSGDFTQIRSGIKAGDRMIASNTSAVKDGDKVQAVTK